MFYAIKSDQQQSRANAKIVPMPGCCTRTHAEPEWIWDKSESGPEKTGTHKRSLLIASLIAVGLFGLLCAFGPNLVKTVKAMGMFIDKPMVVSIDDTFPVVTRVDQAFSVHLDTDIPVSFPVKTVLNVPIHETLEVPVNDALSVKMDEPVFINETIRVQCIIPIDTVVETKIMGITKKIPIKASIPVDINVPIKQNFHINQNLSVRMQEPVSVKVDHVMEAPVDFLVKGVMPLDQEIMTPVQGDLDCMIKMKWDLPLVADLGLKVEDLGNGVKIGAGQAAPQE